MFAEAFTSGASPIHRRDARVRVVGATLLSLSAALAGTLSAQLIALGVGVTLSALARLPITPTLRRLIPLNVFLVAIWLALPFGGVKDSSSAALSSEGLRAALGITLRANAILLIMTALVATLDIVEFGRALRRLYVPPKLVTLLLFTVRYTAVLRGEYAALRRAMRVRCFSPRTNGHTLRTLGYLAGMLLVRGFERSERVLMAMKCRGYTGAFPLRESRAMNAADTALFTGTALSAVLVLWAGAL